MRFAAGRTGKSTSGLLSRYDKAARPLGGYAMLLSRDRILTTHVGSLPRNEALSELLMAREAGQALRQGAVRAARWTRPIRHVVDKQREAGIDIGNDGEQQRVGFQTYVPQRMSGFGGVSQAPPRPRVRGISRPARLHDEPLPARRPRASTGAPQAQAELKYLDIKPIEQELARFKAIAGSAASPRLHDRGLARHHLLDDAQRLLRLRTRPISMRSRAR